MICVSKNTNEQLLPPILASASPRRHAWMSTLRIPFEVLIPNVDETPLPEEAPNKMVMRLACIKAECIAKNNSNRWVIAADTVVAVDQNTLGKPTSIKDAIRMLTLMQGRDHVVHTALCLQKNDLLYTLADTTKVFLQKMTQDQISWYVNTGEPMDKAGAYAIQGIASLFIDKTVGSFSTVTGFPVELFSKLAYRLGLLSLWTGMP
jgi:septum formation protein